jgi:SAM-dependent methyltransferase
MAAGSARWKLLGVLFLSSVDVTFTDGVVEGLPFPDEHFDAVLSTLMLHHLPRAAREQCVREIRRVLKPGGRVLAVDFGGATGGRKSLIEHFHRHGRVDVPDIVKLLSEAGLEIIESGPVGLRLVIKHVGLLGPLYALFRRRRPGHGQR